MSESLIKKDQAEHFEEQQDVKQLAHEIVDLKLHITELEGWIRNRLNWEAGQETMKKDFRMTAAKMLGIEPTPEPEPKGK